MKNNRFSPHFAMGIGDDLIQLWGVTNWMKNCKTCREVRKPNPCEKKHGETARDDEQKHIFLIGKWMDLYDFL